MTWQKLYICIFESWISSRQETHGSHTCTSPSHQGTCQSVTWIKGWARWEVCGFQRSEGRRLLLNHTVIFTINTLEVLFSVKLLVGCGAHKASKESSDFAGKWKGAPHRRPLCLNGRLTGINFQCSFLHLSPKKKKALNLNQQSLLCVCFKVSHNACFNEQESQLWKTCETGIKGTLSSVSLSK